MSTVHSGFIRARHDVRRAHPVPPGIVVSFHEPFHDEDRYPLGPEFDDSAQGSVRPEAQAVHTIAGDPDALVQVRVRDITHLQEVIDRPRRTGTVTKTLMVSGRWTRT